MRKRSSNIVLSVLASALLATLFNSAALAAEGLVVYTARKEHLVKPLFDAYTKKTGVKILYHTLQVRQGAPQFSV